MKINFISHLNPFYFHGGGEQYTRAIIEAGRSLGHEIIIASIRPGKAILHQYPDYNILWDIWNCPGGQKFNDEFIASIINNDTPYILGQCGYCDSCNLACIPCNGHITDGVNCVENQEFYSDTRDLPGPWNNWQCSVKQNEQLFRNAYKLAFLSPVHLETHVLMYGPQIRYKSFIVRPIVDTKLFTNTSQKRTIKYAADRANGEPKGFYNIKRLTLDSEVTIFGSNISSLAGKHNFGNNIGRLQYDQVPHFLNQVETLIHLPRWPEANGLIVNQAALCGCEVMTNRNVGAVSHGFDIADPKSYEGAAVEFWENVK